MPCRKPDEETVERSSFLEKQNLTCPVQAPDAPYFHCCLGMMDKHEECWEPDPFKEEWVTERLPELRDLVALDKGTLTGYETLPFEPSGESP